MKRKFQKINIRTIKENFNIDEKLNLVIKKLKNSKRPLIHLGHGVKLSAAQKLVKIFFNKFKIPFVVTWNADDIINSNHKMYCGRPGAFGERGSNFIVQNCDFYLSLGTRLPYMVTGYNAKNFAAKAKFKVMIDIDPKELNKTDLKIDLTIESDAKVFLKKFFNRLKKYQSSDEWLSYCQNIRKKYPILLKQMIDEKNFVNSYYFVKTLSKYTKKNDSIITDMGFSFTTTHQAFDVKNDQTFFTNSGHAPMGWGLPAAIGAYYAKKQKKSNLICLTGDGSFK